MSSGDINVTINASGTVQTTPSGPPPGATPGTAAHYQWWQSQQNSQAGIPQPPGGTSTATPPPPPTPPAPSAPTPPPPSPSAPSTSTPPPPPPGASTTATPSVSPPPPGGTAGGASAASGASAAAGAMAAVTAAAFALKLQFDIMVGTAQAVDDWLTELARSAKRFSGEVAAATALANVSDLLGDIQQGQQLGPDLAQYVSARSDLASTVKRIETLLASDTLPAAIEMVNLLNRASRGLESLYDSVSNGTGIRSWLPIVLTTWFQASTVPGQFVFLLDQLNTIANNTEPDVKAKPAAPTQDFNNFINQVMQGFQNQQAGAQPFIIP